MLRDCLLAALVALFLQTVISAPQDDLIDDLPGLTFTPDFKQYSGYLQGDNINHLHYWLVESSNNSQKDPLVFWLTNGNPYASALYALFVDNGPFKVSTNGKTLAKNPNSWNKVANVVYLEVPVCTGYSYADDGVFHNSSDDSTTKDIYLAIKDFFKKFPEYSTNDLYLAGQWYAGIYAPLLASAISNDPDIKLTGFLVGNGLMDEELKFNSLVYYSYHHGFISTSFWDKLLYLCCPDNPARCDFFNNVNETCRSQYCRLKHDMLGRHINTLNIYSDDPTPPFYEESSAFEMMADPCETEVKEERSRDTTVQTPRTVDEGYLIYLNLPEVRKAIHIPDALPNWTYPSYYIEYYGQYHYLRQQFLEAIKNKMRILVYSGDTDLLANFIGADWFVNSLNDTNPTEYNEWFYTKNGNKVNGGFYRTYDHITVATVRGAGQRVSHDKPEAALQMFTNFMRNQPFGDNF